MKKCWFIHLGVAFVATVLAGLANISFGLCLVMGAILGWEGRKFFSNRTKENLIDTLIHFGFDVVGIVAGAILLVIFT